MSRLTESTNMSTHNHSLSIKATTAKEEVLTFNITNVALFNHYSFIAELTDIFGNNKTKKSVIFSELLKTTIMC